MQKDNMQNTKFRVGQTVWCLLYGEGKVVEIAPGDDYPIMVAFGGEDDVISYTADGKYYSNANRTLFFSEPEVIAATEPVFEPKLVGRVVLVKNLGGEEVGFGYVEDESASSILIDNCSYPKCTYNFYEFKDQPIAFN